jgi:radical SAM protein (TIGR01212 family)
MQGGERYNSINDYLKSVFGRKTVKLSIDAGFTCPNRDGSKGYGGCHFCSEGGSGELASRLENASGLHESMKESITAQIDRLSAKWPDACYIAYFQSFSGTYAPVDYLRAVYYAALSDPRISGIAISTRPDCLPDEVLDLLSDINRDYFMWTELGLQSIHKKTADDMNLCYDVFGSYNFALTLSGIVGIGIAVLLQFIVSSGNRERKRAEKAIASQTKSIEAET